MTIGLPVFNDERYLPLAIESVLGQTYENLEILIADNASTDRAPEIIAAFARRDSRIRVIRQARNVGAAENFNTLIRGAAGQYLMFTASDDLRLPTCVAQCVEAAEASGAAVVGTGIRLIDPEGRQVSPHPPGMHFPVSGRAPLARLRNVCRSAFWYDHYGLLRTESLRRTRLCRPVWMFDVVLLAELALQGAFVQVPEPLFRYRQYPGKTNQGMAATIGDPLAPPIPANAALSFLELLRGVRHSPLGPAHRRLAVAVAAVQVLVLNPSWRAHFREDVAGALAAGSLEAGDPRLLRRLSVLAAIPDSVVETLRRAGGNRRERPPGTER